MRVSSLILYLSIVAGLIILTLLLYRPSLFPPVNDEPVNTLDINISQLYGPEGNVEFICCSDGVPIFRYSVPMKNLVEKGSAIQSRLLVELKDQRIRNEVVLILAEIGDKDALPCLIELLPDTEEEKQTEEERFTTMCLLHALFRITGVAIGIDYKLGLFYKAEFRTQWQNWYEKNKDYLYSPSKRGQIAIGSKPNGILVDMEAKLATKPSTAYRQEHPWIAFEEIKNWRDDPNYQQKLKDFCFSIILNPTSSAHGHISGGAIRCLGHIQDPRALSLLHALCAMNNDDPLILIQTLEEKGEPSSIPVLEKISIPESEEERKKPYSTESRRTCAIKRIRLLEKYGKEIKDKPFDAGQQTVYLKCLEGPKGVDDLVAELNNPEHDCFFSHYAQVAGYLEREPIRSCLEQITRDESRGLRLRTMAYGALAHLGDKDSLEHLRELLMDNEPGVRLAAAEGLWNMGHREGFQTLLGILDVRPIETGGEGVGAGDGSYVVKAIPGSNVEYIRRACKILGDMGDRTAIKPLKQLLTMNLNGVLAGGGSGIGMPGRPDAVALAKLGDFSGIDVLRASIIKGDPLEVIGNWGCTSDFVKIGLKRYIPEILPMLHHQDEGKRMLAALAIIILLERAK